MSVEHAADRATELEQELDEEFPLELHPELEFEVETESSGLRPPIRSICGEARRIRSRLLGPQRNRRGGATVTHAEKFLRRTSSRWPYERFVEDGFTIRELDTLAGCLYGVARAMGYLTEPYRRLISDIWTHALQQMTCSNCNITQSLPWRAA